MSPNGAAPTAVTDAVLKPSNPVPDGAIPVEGVEFGKFAHRNISVSELVDGMANMGFQASSIGQAVQIVDGMVSPAALRSARYPNSTDWLAAEMD